MTLRTMEDIVPQDPGSLYPNIGPYAMQLFESVRGGGSSLVVADGKYLIDSLLANGYTDIEALVQAGLTEGKTLEEIYLSAAGEPKPYTSSRPTSFGRDGESMLDFALRLRENQSHIVKDGNQEFTLSYTCDGRYEPETYPLDSWSIVKGLAATRNIDQVRDMTDFYARQILKYGYPFNGIRVEGRNGGDPSKDPNYYAFRSQSPTFFYMIRLMGEFGGDDVFAHEPYVRAMERLWTHFNPDPQLLAAQPGGQFHAYRRGGISPEGYPFSVFGDDTNNGRAYKNYTSARPESHKEDVEIARKAASRAAPEDRERVFGETLVHLAGAAEWGWDMSASRQANNKDLSHINTTNIIPLELQCMLADGAEVLAYSYRVRRQRAEARNDMEAANQAYQKELYYLKNRQDRINFINKYMYSPKSGTYHDVELLGPTASYDSLRTYRGARRNPVVSAASLHPLYSGVVPDADTALSVMRVAKRELYNPGGLAVTNRTPEEPEQWDGINGWTTPERVGVCAPVHAAARFANSHPRAARTLLEDAVELRTRALHGSETAYRNTRTLVETINTRNPHKRPITGEYPKDINIPGTPLNFAMRREHVIDLTLTDLEQKYRKLIPVAGRFVVANA